MDPETIFLTTEQAVAAICIDFRQYEPQFMLFSEIIRLISDDTIHLKSDPEKNGAWVSRRGHTKMSWLPDNELIEFMCRRINETRWNPQLLAAVCGRVFQSRSRPAQDPETGGAGVWIDTNMGAFACLQCGQCCRALDYHNEVTAEDMANWRDMKRDDLLKRVQTITNPGGKTTYRIWMDPETGRIADPCPYLKKEPAHNRWSCAIHDVKPTICRQYPVSRKHAVMTGCRGFQKQPARK